ncbi:MAG: Eco57I restriction-modification methylase domain-containing protein [Prevotella sp.]
MQDKDKLIDLVRRYQAAKFAGQLENSSEATIRTWIDEFLSVFGWDVQNTQQVLTEHTLGRSEKEKLRDIGSTNTRPDYTLVNGSVMLTFVDAKSLNVNIETDKDAAFQIRSYGWSIGAPFSIVTNFEQLAIYDCSVMPDVFDEADYARIHFYEHSQFVEMYDTLKVYLSRENIIGSNIKFVRGKGNTLDEKFSQLLGDVRKELAEAILDKNDITNIATLSFYVQTIINRVLFIRVCESRGLEKDKLLLDFAADNFWEAFKRSSYAEFYDHYDGPMFKRIVPLQSLSIDNDVFTHFLNSLYYPSPYRFDVIPLKTLSDIYDLFLGYQLVVRNGKVTDELKEEFKKSNGAVTTPEHLVNKVIDSTFSTSLKCMSIFQILKINIVDIACGSGVFIVGAYEYIVKEIERRVRAGEPIDDNYYILQDGHATLTIEGRKAIINNCLYGVDINPEAVEVAKMSLSLKLIDNYAPKDFGVVGLPPYVEVKNYNCNLPLMAVYIKRVYSSSKDGKIDLAIPFIERGISLLNGKGRLGYIVQKRFFKTEYGKGIRKLLTTRQLLNGIYDYAETDLFAGRITYVAILVCDKNKQNNINVWYLNSSEGRQQLLQAKSLSETPWNFENAALNALRLRLSEELGTLGDVCHIKVGLQMLWNDVYQIVADRMSDGIIYGHSVIDNHVEVEMEACRPLLCNEQFSPLTKRQHTTFALFPYSVTAKGEVTELTISEFTTLYPKAGAYLAKHKNLICKTVETLPQRNGEYNFTDHWHLFTRANNHGAIYEKLCVPMTAQYPQAAVVMEKHVYCDNANMFFIQIDNPDEKHLYALAAIINSTIFNTLARSIANPQQGGYYKFNKQFLDPVPFPKDAFIKCGRNITNLARTAKKIEQTNELIRNSVGLQTSGLILSLNSLWRQLDQMCDKLYGIKKAEDKALLYSTIRKDRNPYGQES